MQAKEAFEAASSAEKVASSLYKWIAGNRGLKRTVAVELQENIELIRLYVETSSGYEQLIPQIKESAYRNALQQGFNFNSLNRSKIDAASTKGIKQLERYHGWETQQVIESIYAKISAIKAAIKIKDNAKPLRLGVRLHNIFKLLVMLSNHIGQK
ncbi:hypothetical protein OPW33_22145 [Vibrio europaeus]|uniref:hypothetical protein n=1 Tax=Vibrio europaeus TaxID=300876 RepID=UPI00233E5778|nr:hypothetical protein [Vibrio europaeus]MDC5842030.1 hypothetical protein [Vibrio europaeus]MDC5870673.1 hypothetical protein [Vibrio europaeus]